MKFCSDICDLQMMNPPDFGDRFTFPEAPP